MEPILVTSPELQPVLEALKGLEPLIYAANAGAKTDYFDQLLAHEFWEVGASGRRYSREFVLDALDKRQKNPYGEAWYTSDYYLQKLSALDYLMSYTLHQPTRKTRRASIWRQQESEWVLVYHQGTVVQEL